MDDPQWCRVRETVIRLEVPVDGTQDVAEVWEMLARLAAAFTAQGKEVQLASETVELHRLEVGDE